jgi:hypothetical protein
MPTARSFRKQAARCTELAEQTSDEESRQRYLRLAQIYLEIAETEESLTAQPAAFVNENEKQQESPRLSA